VPLFFADNPAGLIRAVAITAFIFTAPALLPGMGWLHGLMPLPVCYFARIHGLRHGAIITALAVALAGIITLPAGTFPVLLFSLVMPPMGFILAEAGTSEGSTRRAAFRSIFYLIAVWLVGGWLISLSGGGNLYHELRLGLDKGFEATFAMYQQTGHLSADELAGLKSLIEQLKKQAARIFPALLLSSAIITVWLNIALARWLLRRKNPALAGPDELKNWRLPDLLVWPLILAGFALLATDEKLNTLGLNAGLALMVLYLSQGLAVAASLMQRWSLPPLIRAITYALLFIQLYGLAFLSLLGLADVWADFRKQRQAEPDAEDASVS